MHINAPEGSEKACWKQGEVRVIAGRIAYQLMCNQQIDMLYVATHMLRQIGENINQFFKHVAFHTSKRLLRRRLFRHLKHMRRLSKEDRRLLAFVEALERVYPS